MSDTPLGQARQALLDAKAKADHSPSTANLKALEDARVAMDALLDAHPSTPVTPVVHSPGVAVSPSLLSHEAYRELYPSSLGSEERECDGRTAQQGDDSGAEQ